VIGMKPAAGTRAGRWRRAAAAGLMLAGLAWTGVSAALWFGQERLLLKPVPLPPDASLSSDPDVTERFVDVPGARLSVLELRRPDPKLHRQDACLRNRMSSTPRRSSPTVMTDR
jgi:hypothetical protein